MKMRKILNDLKSVYAIILKYVLQHKAMMMLIPGIYERQKKDGVVTVTETIWISELSVVAELYQIKLLKVEEFKQDDTFVQRKNAVQWLAVYNPLTRQLLEPGTNRVCSFYPEKSKLFLDQEEFSKL